MRNTAERYPLPERVTGLSISHHMRAVHLKPGERKKLLERAKMESWSVRQVEERIGPRDRQFVRFIMKVPMATARDTKFDLALRRFLRINNLNGHYMGTVRAAPKRRVGGTRALRAV